VLEDLDRHPEAEQVILGLLREDPADAGLHAAYGRLMLVNHQLDKARALVAEALRLDPDEPGARAIDALLALVDGRDRAARERVAGLLREAPEAESVAWLLVAVLEHEGRRRDALQIARELLRARPGDPDVLRALVGLRAATHWSSAPLWPFHRFGWGAVVGLWLGVNVLAYALPDRLAGLLWIVNALYLALVVYSWLQPPLLRRWLRWRGF
jgi:tetratricopeptide (TPR) repeat protein